MSDGNAAELSTREVVDLAQEARKGSKELVEQDMADKVRAGECSAPSPRPFFSGPSDVCSVCMTLIHAWVWECQDRQGAVAS